ncbi:MAG: response regulator [Rubrivivax sp.]|nr:response regulator [Rubrivivax sp.]
MDQVWREAPVAALRLTRSGPRLGVERNAVARAWPVADADWQQLALAQARCAPGEDEVQLGPMPLHCRRVGLPDGLLLWLTPLNPRTPLPPPAADPLHAERIALLRGLGRIGLYLRDIVGGAGRWDASMFEITGLDPAGGTPDWARFLAECVHPADREALDRHYQGVQHEAGRGEVHFRILRPDGQERWLHSLYDIRPGPDGQPGQLLGVVVDDTVIGQRVEAGERSMTERDALAEQSRMVAQAMGVGFWQRDGQGQTVLWDTQMYRLYGRAAGRAPPSMHEWIDEYVLPEQRDSVRRTLDADVAAWASATLVTVGICGDDGVLRQVRAWTRRYERDGQRIAMGMHLDVSEQIRQEALQRDAERSARASREKSAFMARMSHRLRTPLNAVLGFAQVMGQDGQEPLSARQRERLARIDAAGHDLLAMIDDVFELAELGADSAPPTRLPVPLAAVLTQLREAVEPLARQRGVALRLPEPPAGLHLATDRRLLGQALLHLTAHAVRRNHPGGWIELRLQAEPGWCALELHDGGPALTLQQRELLFDAPSQPPAEAAHGDALVGLDLVRQALERLGGQVDWLHPQATDSALVVRLPLSAAGSEPTVVPRLSLLCVEDNPVNLMLVQELVSMRPGIRFFSAEDGETGLALARAERPDVVLLDLHLPDIPGQTVLTRLRADPLLAGCRVIALSANAMPEDIRDALALGFDDYWTKPIAFDHFLAGLDRLAAGPVTAPDAP